MLVEKDREVTTEVGTDAVGEVVAAGLRDRGRELHEELVLGDAMADIVGLDQVMVTLLCLRVEPEEVSEDLGVLGLGDDYPARHHDGAEACEDYSRQLLQHSSYVYFVVLLAVDLFVHAAAVCVVAQTETSATTQRQRKSITEPLRDQGLDAQRVRRLLPLWALCLLGRISRDVFWICQAVGAARVMSLVEEALDHVWLSSRELG